MLQQRVKPVSGILISRPEVLTADRTVQGRKKPRLYIFLIKQTGVSVRHCSPEDNSDETKEEGRERERENVSRAPVGVLVLSKFL